MLGAGSHYLSPSSRTLIINTTHGEREREKKTGKTNKITNRSRVLFKKKKKKKLIPAGGGPKILKYYYKFLVVFFFCLFLFGLRNEMKSIGKLVNSNIFVCFPRIELLMITKCCLSKPPTTGVSVSFQHKFQLDFPRIETHSTYKRNEL